MGQQMGQGLFSDLIYKSTSQQYLSSIKIGEVPGFSKRMSQCNPSIPIDKPGAD
jgi:hypothetical protein